VTFTVTDQRRHRSHRHRRRLSPLSRGAPAGAISFAGRPPRSCARHATVWIDVLNDVPAPQAQRCVALIEAGEPVALTDVIFTEVLQGFRSEREARQVEHHLRAFPILRLDDLEDFTLSAQLYRSARRAGITIRKTLDCLIAAPCVRTGAPLLHADADFDRLVSCTALRLWSEV